MDSLLQQSGALALTATLALGFAIALLVILGIIRRYLYVCRPNELLVVAGRKHRLPGGETVNFTVVLDGTLWRVPFLQTVDRMDLRLIPIDLQVSRVLSNGGIPLDIHAVATVKISSDPRYVYNAVERFLNVPKEAIWNTAKQTMEGGLREVISQLTPEQVNQDRIEFANRLLELSSQVFCKMGLQLDTLKIQRVEDEAKYLVNLGRAQIANAVRDAENAESQANQETAQEEATARQQVEMASKQAQIGVTQKKNQLRALVGQLEGKAQAVEREGKAAAEQAQAEAEQELQTLRKELEQRRLAVEVVLPAEAQRAAAELLAQGAAAYQREQGAAAAEALRAQSEAIAAAGPQARELFLLSQLDTLVAQLATQVKGISIKNLQVVDSGDVRSLPQIAAGYPQAVLLMLRELTGLDLSQMLAGSMGAESRGGVK